MIQWCIPNGENQGMRDYIKSEQYFDEFIAEDTARILKLTQKVNGGEVRPDIFQIMKELVKERDKSDLLEKYLKEDWYNKEYECYEVHKSDQNIYYGYWSFEAGAIAKILNLDDSNLKNVPYYPYDLVHYKR